MTNLTDERVSYSELTNSQQAELENLSSKDSFIRTLLAGLKNNPDQKLCLGDIINDECMSSGVLTSFVCAWDDILTCRTMRPV
ncbi:MAG: hypothetical protein ACKKL5_01860 [Candidatus Komeilibacteria bacterium]